MRLAVLHKTGLLDTRAEPGFDRLTRLAAKLLRAPVALVSLVDHDRQFFKSSVCLSGPWEPGGQTPLTHSFCKHVVTSGRPLIIEDARRDPLVSDNLAVSELGVVAYAGIPLITSTGQALGSFCAIDERPRSWTADEIDMLEDLAASVVTEMELRLAVNEAQEQAAAAAREREEKLALLESTTEGIYGIDTDGCFTFLNRAAAGLTRFEPEEVLGRNAHALIHHSRPDGSAYPEDECPIFRAFLQGEGCHIADEVLWRKDGTSFPAEYASAPIIRDGRIQGAVVTIVNIARRKELEQLRDDLTHMIVHDLRTPLTSLLGGIQTLQMTDLDADQREMLDWALSGGNTLLGMINDLLDISKMESGSMTLDYKQVAPADLARQALSQVDMLARAKDISIDFMTEPGLPDLAADPDKLRRTLVNLLGNALKFTPRNGRVSLSVRRERHSGSGDSFTFSVTDTGEGIPPEAFDKIFEKFGQVESRQAGRKMSTGLGLTFCKMAVEAHGGRIWVESEPGHGSTFSFTVPIRPAY
jgi:PAS domain S-box-containing protein